MTVELARVGFAGTPEFAAVILSALIKDRQNLQVVYTQPDRRAGRGRRLTANPVKQLALNHGISVAQPVTLKTPEAQRDLNGHQLDLLIVAAYGLILPQAILDTPRLGCVNVHASLLPRWRGAAPVERAIMAGDSETGVSIMHMDAGLDTGPVYASRRVPITATSQGPELEAELAACGAALLLELLPNIEAQQPVPQTDAGTTYAHKLTKADAAVSWNTDAIVVDRQIRALCGRMPATVVRGDFRIKLLRASPLPEPPASSAPGTIVRSGAEGIVVACKPGCISLERLQLNKGKGTPMDAQAACNGYPDVFAAGKSLVSDH